MHGPPSFLSSKPEKTRVATHPSKKCPLVLRDPKHPRARAVMTRLEGEVTRLLKTALEGTEAKVRFEGIEPANPLGVRANVVVTLPQSRFGNANAVKELFLDTLDK